MKKKLTSILAGLTTAALALSLCTSALAAPAGRKAADETGKKASQVSKTVPGRAWQREYLEGYLYYVGPAPAKAPEGERLPVFQPAWLPEGWALESVATNGVPDLPDDTLSTWWTYYSGNSRETLFFVCYLRPCGGLGGTVGASTSGDSVLYKTTIQGHDADFYQGDEQFGNDLIWENERGNLFHLFGHLDRSTMEKIANSVVELQAGTVPEYALTALPTGVRQVRHSVQPEYVETFWSLDDLGTLTFTYTTLPLSPGKAALAGQAEAVKVKGLEARFYQGEKTPYTRTVVGKDKVPVVTTRELCFNTLFWTDPETKISFCLKGHLDREVLLYLAERIALKAPESPAESGK